MVWTPRRGLCMPGAAGSADSTTKRGRSTPQSNAVGIGVRTPSPHPLSPRPNREPHRAAQAIRSGPRSVTTEHFVSDCSTPARKNRHPARACAPGARRFPPRHACHRSKELDTHHFSRPTSQHAAGARTTAGHLRLLPFGNLLAAHTPDCASPTDGTPAGDPAPTARPGLHQQPVPERPRPALRFQSSLDHGHRRGSIRFRQPMNG